MTGVAEEANDDSGGESTIALPAPPYTPAESEVFNDAPVQIRLADGRTRHGRLRSLDATLGALRFDEGETTTTVGTDEVLEMLFTRPLDPADAAAAKRAVPFEIGLADGRVLRGTTLGSIRRPDDLHLFARRQGHFHRVYLPTQGIVDERIGLPLGRILVEQHGVSQRHVDAAVTAQKGERPATFQRGRERLGERLRREGNLGDDALAQALAAKLGLSYLGANELEPTPDALEHVPITVAREAVALPLAVNRKYLRVAVADPTNTEELKRLEFVAGIPLDIVVAPGDAIVEKLGSIETRLEEHQAMRDLGLSGEAASQERQQVATEKLAAQKPIVRLVGQLLGDAITRRASDIHIRPDEKGISLLYRIDGMLVPVQEISKPLLPALIGRIKVLGRMDIAERRIPQDGRTEVTISARRVDVRISIIPTVHGESAVLRLLDTEAGIRSVEQLGLSEADTEHFRDLISRKHGMFLVTGPTGSGKSTTLYAALGEVRKRPVNIITVEDPVEYHLSGLQQIQVERAAGLTFASALRNILRHDPDVIMIGEIRDGETAKIATESALTGHLVFSTLHTNSAAGSITRLLEMGVQAYLLQPSLLGILAQRLVRRNCRHCLVNEEVGAHARQALGLDPAERFQCGRGCKRCNQTGYSGRLVAYELLRVTEAMRSAIESEADEAQLNRIAEADGMVRLTDHALALARAGETSLEEAYRLRVD